MESATNGLYWKAPQEESYCDDFQQIPVVRLANRIPFLVLSTGSFCEAFESNLFAALSKRFLCEAFQYNPIVVLSKGFLL